MRDAVQLLSVLFDVDEKIQIRVLHETEKRAVCNKVFASTAQAVAYLAQLRSEFERELSFPCVGVNPRDTNGRVATIKNLVVDIDSAPLPSWAMEYADVICSRDESHHHLYFCFQPLELNEKTRKQYSQTVKKLLQLSGSSEKSAHDPERVIRLPGFAHAKNGTPGPGYRIVFMRDDIRRISFDEKFSWTKNLTCTKNETSSPPAQAAVVDAAQDKALAYIESVYLKKPIVPAGAGRSRELFFIGLDCHAWGIEIEEAIKLAAKITKTRHAPPESEKIVRHQVESAYKYRKGEFGDMRSRTQDATEKQQLRELKRFELINKARDTFADWVYCHGAVRFIERTTNRALTAHDQITSFVATKLGQKIPFDDLLAAQAIETVDLIEYAPDIPEQIFERDGLRYYNSYRPVTAADKKELSKAEAKKAVQIFREHIAYITTSEEEEKTLLQFFAYATQNPGKKIAWAPLIITPKTGTGKSFFGALLERLCGDHNVSHVLSHDLLSRFNDYIAEKLWVVAHEVETAEKEVMARLKSLITEKRVRVEGKYARTYITKNCANFIFLSNKIDAIKSDREDRRLFVIYNNCEPKEQEYYDRLFGVLDWGVEAIRDYLMSVDTSNFNPHARPPKTKGWAMLTRASESDLANYLAECEQEKSGVFAREFFALKDLAADIAINAPGSAKYATNRALAVWLYGRGYESREVYIDGKHLRYWTKLSDTELKKAVKDAMRNSKNGVI